jgi:hypothetical protein
MQIPFPRQNGTFGETAPGSIILQLDNAETGYAGMLHLTKAQWRKLREAHLCTIIKIQGAIV